MSSSRRKKRPVSPPSAADMARHAPELHDADVLFEDAHIVVIHKPAGLLSQASPDPHRPHVISRLQALWQTRHPEHPDPYFAVHHRLDLETSGVMVLAASREANEGLMRAFHDRLASKRYHALCLRPEQPLPATLTNHLAAAPRADRRQRGPTPMVAVRAGGDFASTDFEVLARGEQVVHVLATPETGRRHQIRAHLSSLGAPLLGDTLYQGPTQVGARRVPRVMLHAQQLTLPHPISGEMLTFEADLPSDFNELMRDLL